jgi:hypothetical protein
MEYIICPTFKAQINHMWFKKEFKVSEILCVTTFDIIYTSNFDTSAYTISWKHLETQLGKN